MLQRHYNIDNCAASNLIVKDYNFDKKSDKVTDVNVIVSLNGKEVALHGKGNGPISSFLNGLSSAFGVKMEVESYAEHSVGQGSTTKAATYVKISCGDKYKWGIGMHESITRASVNSIVSAVNSLIKAGALDASKASSSEHALRKLAQKKAGGSI